MGKELKLRAFLAVALRLVLGLLDVMDLDTFWFHFDGLSSTRSLSDLLFDLLVNTLANQGDRDQSNRDGDHQRNPQRNEDTDVGRNGVGDRLFQLRRPLVHAEEHVGPQGEANQDRVELQRPCVGVLRPEDCRPNNKEDNGATHRSRQRGSHPRQHNHANLVPENCLTAKRGETEPHNGSDHAVRGRHREVKVRGNEEPKPRGNVGTKETNHEHLREILVQLHINNLLANSVSNVGSHEERTQKLHHGSNQAGLPQCQGFRPH
mmetsp:Transcript_44179/g.79304  ORF Transcript_44179/g.79304 Transcript_44179/m.79304 type:complete len:263 (+) Transcript_44179:816-1604(+)